LGILPISQSSFVESSVLANFPLTGSGEPHSNCGVYFTVGCLNVEEHHGTTLDGVNMSAKAYLERHKMSCHRAICPICWSDWANREKDKATERLKAFVLKGRSLKPIHLTVSVSRADYGLSLEGMRKKSYGALKMVHCLGGMMIFHSKRKDTFDTWYYSPHFHIIGYGWIVDVRRTYEFSGYVIKNIGIRKTVEGTIYYQLSHAGISEKHHTITWFGGLSYAKLHVEYTETEESVCPVCKERLYRLIWIGEGKCELPDVEGMAFFDDPDNWMIKTMRYSDE